jgi:26S proteasome regulatory subunit N2
METDEKTEGTKETKEKTSEKEKEKKQEPPFEILENPARVTRAQLKYLTFDVDPRYVPIAHQGDLLGIVMLKDKKPEEKEELITEAVTTTTVEVEAEAPPPEPFEYQD